MTTAAPARSSRKKLDIPTTMKAAAIDRFGRPDVLKVHTLPVPELRDHDVLIALYSAGVGSWDAEIRSGHWASEKVKFPAVLGMDGAGVVVAKGSRVRRFAVGDRVWAYTFESNRGGFYAEYIAVDADSVGKLPARLDLEQAGAAAVTGLTAQQGINEHLRVRRGETVLVFGATGAVGTLAVQFARRKRARVLATASGRAASTLMRKLGAAEVFDARKRSEIERLEEFAPDGIDAALVLAGGADLERCLDHVRPGGRVAFPDGVEPEPKRRRRFHVMKYNAEAGPAEWERLGRAAVETKLRVPIAASYPLAQAARAHARIERGHVVGRILLRIRRD